MLNLSLPEIRGPVSEAVASIETDTICVHRTCSIDCPFAFLEHYRSLGTKCSLCAIGAKIKELPGSGKVANVWLEYYADPTIKRSP